MTTYCAPSDMPSVTIEIRAEPVTGYLQDLHSKLADLRPVLLDILQDWHAGA